MPIRGRPSGSLPPPDTQAHVRPTAEACSTTEDGAEPLLCPSGYECHILSPGDVAEGIPNRGQCVKQRRQAGECGRPSRAPGSCPRLPRSPHVGHLSQGKAPAPPKPGRERLLSSYFVLLPLSLPPFPSLPHGTQGFEPCHLLAGIGCFKSLSLSIPHL